MTPFVILAGIFGLAGFIYLAIAAPGLALTLTLITFGLAILFGLTWGAILIYGRLGAARKQHAEVNLIQAQAFATTVEAAKVPITTAGLALPHNSRVQIVMLPQQPAAQLAATIPAPALAAPAVEPIEIGSAGFFDYVPANPFRNGELFLRVGIGAGNREITRPVTELTHFLPAGKTKSGKSTWLRSIAAQTLIGEIDAPGRARIALIDLTGITFNADLFKGLPQTYGGQVAKSDYEAIALINELLAECERRSRLYSAAPGLPESLPEYNAAVPPAMRLPVIMAFVEEMSALADYAGDKFLSPLKRLLWQARKFGIYLANAGQDFRAKTVDKTITDNSSSRFIFGQVDDMTARVIGFDPKRHRVSIDRPGRGLVMLNGEVQEFQGLWLPKPEFVGLMNELRLRANLQPVGGANSATARPAPASAGNYGFDPYQNTPQAPSGRPGASYEAAPVEASYRVLPQAPNEIEQAARLWQNGYTSARALAECLGCGKDKANRLINEARSKGLI